MVLHLLGKKSWNVYNQENIARVRRDEAEAEAREEEEKRLKQERDAQRRLAILRGERPLSPSPPPEEAERHDAPSRREEKIPRERRIKKRKLAGEDDTDRDMRIARETAELDAERHANDVRIKSSDAPLLDSEGHTVLFPAPSSKEQKKASSSTVDKTKEDELVGMRFSHAAGYRQNAKDAWYLSSMQNIADNVESLPSKDVWGNEDPRRQERQHMRTISDDPLAAIKRGVRQLRDVEKARKQAEEERRQSLEALRDEDRERHQSRRRRRSRSPDASRHSRDRNEDRHRRHRNHSRDHSHRHRHHSHHHRDSRRERSGHR